MFKPKYNESQSLATFGAWLHNSFIEICAAIKDLKIPVLRSINYILLAWQ